MGYLLDTITNLVAKLNTGDKKLANDQFALRELQQSELMALYRSDWLGRKIVDAPVKDMFRQWRNWQAAGNNITIMESAEDHFGVAKKLSRAMSMARLFGGAGIVIGADVARPDQPLLPGRIGKGGLKYLTVCTKYDLRAGEVDRDVSSPTFGEPKYYVLGTQNTGAVYLHPSRVLRFIGADRLDVDFNIDGYGDSTLMAIYDAIHHAAMAQAGIAELIHEAKVDVISIPNLSSALATDPGTQAIAKRFQAANSLKSINNMLLLDEKEKWERKQTSFDGLPDLLDRYLAIVSAASDIPATRLLGQAPKGMNATGDGDLRNYYDMLVSVRQDAIGPQLAYLDQILWLDATGSIPRDVHPEWNPLWQLTTTEKASSGYQKAQTTQIYAQLGIIDETALAEGTINQLIEDGVYPGLEQAIAKQIQAGGTDFGEGEGQGEQEETAAPNSTSDIAKRFAPIRARGRW